MTRTRKGTGTRGIVIAVALVGIWGACKPPALYEGWAPGKTKAAVFGDSITYGATPEGRHANARLADPLAISWNSQPFLSTPYFQNHLQYVGWDKPAVVVIATGTNDAWDGVTTADSQAIDAALRAVAGNPCVLWVNVRREISRNHLKWNFLLKAKVAGSAQRRVLDWDAHSDGHPEWINALDNVHLTATGNEAYATWLVDEMARGCGP